MDNFYENLIENLFDGIYYVDKNKKITLWNKSAERITGYKKEEVIGNCCANNILRHVDDSGNELCKKGCLISKTMISGKIQETSMYLHHKNGHRVSVNVRVIPIIENKKITGAIEIFSDNFKKNDFVKEIEKLKKESMTDPLTKVGNRKYADFRLLQCYNDYLNLQMPFGILFIDIDHFKNFNDTYGHKIGDKVLQMVSKTLINGTRSVDLVTRWGGEEFVVIIPNINYSVLQEIAERVRMLVEHSWLDHKNQLLKVTISVGAGMIHQNESIETFVDRIDQLMYESKKRGRNRVVFDEE